MTSLQAGDGSITTTPGTWPAPNAPAADAPADDAGAAAERVVKAVADETADGLRHQPWIRPLVQTGWVAKGVVYGSIGWAAVHIAFNNPEPVDAEYTGLIRALGADPLSRVLLLAIALGLVFYVAFRFISVALIDGVSLNCWLHRIGYTASALTYTAVGWTALQAAIKGFGGGGRSTVERVSVDLLGTTAGRVVLVIAGIVALGVAAYFFYKGVTRRFLSDIELRSAHPAESRFIELSGAVGWVGRSIITALVAVFVTWAAIDADPSEARGLDRSLHRIADTTAGSLTVLVTGIFLFVYAAFCIASARHRRLAWASNPEPSKET